jgi:hypothetical protein
MATGHITDKTFEELAKALRCWLDFQIHCGRAPLLSEAYLTQPLGEFLLAHYSGYLERELDHPQFKTATKGRSRQIDFVLKSKEQKFLDFGIECKWSGSNPPERQGIVDDVMRLECLRRPVGQAGYSSRFFLLAGRKAAMQKFIDGRINGTGLSPHPKFIDGFLPSLVSTKSVAFKVRACDEYYREYYRSFSTAYKTDLPATFKARMVADQTGENIRVLVWKIGSAQNRSSFSPKTDWPTPAASP